MKDQNKVRCAYSLAAESVEPCILAILAIQLYPNHGMNSIEVTRDVTLLELRCSCLPKYCLDGLVTSIA
jgi:hypothetical protein